MDVYSTYEAKAKLSEIIRKVRAGRRVFITFHGRKVAEIRPIAKEDRTIEDRLLRMKEEGTLIPPKGTRVKLEPVARIPGALERFLKEREEA